MSIEREDLNEMARLLTDALDFVEANEWAGGDDGGPAGCLDCGATEGQQHSERCAWLGLMRRSGRR